MEKFRNPQTPPASLATQGAFSCHLLLLLFLLFSPRVIADNPPFPNQAPQRLHSTTSSEAKVVVNIIDGGIDYLHKDLKGHLAYEVNEDGELRSGWDFVGNDPFPYDFNDSQKDTQAPNPFNAFRKESGWKGWLPRLFEKGYKLYKILMPGAFGHGTHVAGLTLHGCEYECEVTMLRALGKSSNMQNIFDAIKFAGENHADIVNMSLGLKNIKDENGQTTRSKEDIAQMKALILSYPKTLFVVAAGNYNNHFEVDAQGMMPAEIDAPNVMTVGALSGDTQIAPFSNAGAAVDIFAPGVNLNSTYPDDRTTPLSGTSMASPLIAGLAAKILKENPELKGQPIRIASRVISEANSKLFDFVKRERDSGPVEYQRSIFKPYLDYEYFGLSEELE